MAASTMAIQDDKLFHELFEAASRAAVRVLRPTGYSTGDLSTGMCTDLTWPPSDLTLFSACDLT